MSQSTALLYFGKLPARGDFVRSTGLPAVIQTLDRWLTTGVEQMAADPRWKLIYDRAVPLNFAFMGPRNARALVGHVRASSDGSGRRFPFLVGGLTELAAPMADVSHSPMMFNLAWRRLDGLSRQAMQAQEAWPLLQELGQTQLELPANCGPYQRPFLSYLDDMTIGMLEDSLRLAGHDVSVRRLILGLGLLLQPVPASGVQRLDKGVLLPLPADPLAQAQVATLWMHLVCGFLGRADFELALFFPQTASGEPPVMALGFDGASPRLLRALWDTDILPEVLVDTRQADWVEEFVEQDYAVKKLSSYLRQSGLALRLATDTFKEVFLGL